MGGRLELIIILTKTFAVENGVALTYHNVRGLYFLAVVFAVTINRSCTVKTFYLIVAEGARGGIRAR